VSSSAQTPAALAARPGDTVMAAPQSRFDAGAVHRWVLGSGHRSLWPTPVPVQVLDLAGFQGGLAVEGLGGGNQTRSLRFRSVDGRSFTFRSLDKDASRTLDPLLRETLAAKVVQDQVSALFPLSAMVVAPLLEAAGVLHADPTLVVMPDDPALGEHRAEFRWMLGWIEERPDEEGPGFAESDRVVGSPRLFERLEEGPENRVDARAFLRARLMDMLVGDWDRHPDQWRWAGFEQGGVLVFEPVPRDRDWALSRLDGMIAHLTWIPWPHYVGFGPEYPDPFRLTWSGRALDRRILPELEWEDWEAVVADLETRLDDRVIVDAVGRLPDPYLQAIGADLTRALQARRDGLRTQSRAFYDLLAGWVDVHATDEDERLEAERLADGRLVVRLGLVGGAEPFFERTFHPGETREVRIDLRGGDDQAEVGGSSEGDLIVRVIGGGGRDRLADTSGSGRVRLYDSGDATEFVADGGAHVDTRAWTEVEDPSSSTHQARARDWGSRWIPLPGVGFDSDVGLYLGVGAQRTGYGFRQFPHRSRLAASLALGTATGKPRAVLEADLPLRHPLRADLGLEYEGSDLTRFYGLGNRTETPREQAYYEARRETIRLRAGLGWRGPDELAASLGPVYTAVLGEETTGTLVDELDPYGRGDFQTLGAELRMRWDGRDDRIIPTRGARGELSLYAVPAALDALEAYGGVAASGSAYLSAAGRLRPTLALRAGGEKVWGDYPYFDAATVGGAGTLRGYRNSRFAGDASLFASLELRLYLTDFVFLLPGELGLLALTDVGRVFLEGDRGGGWHNSLGGGLWASFVRAWAMSLAVAGSGDGTTVHFGVGMPF
jgi:hypothetical protein